MGACINHAIVAAHTVSESDTVDTPNQLDLIPHPQYGSTEARYPTQLVGYISVCQK